MMKAFNKWWILFLLFFVATAYAEPVQLREIAIVASGEKARISLRFSKIPNYKVFSLANPSRIVIDFQEINVRTNLKKLNLAATPLRDIRTGTSPQQGLRLVLDLRKNLPALALSTSVNHKEQQLIIEFGGALPEVTTVTANEEAISTFHKELNKDEALNEMLKNETQQKPTKAQPMTTVENNKKVKQENKPLDFDNSTDVKTVQTKKSTLISKTTLKKPQAINVRGMRDILIVIDPGHGGKDSGARGLHGIYEKNVVLAISKKLQKYIDQERGMRAILTRDGDYFIGLRERLRIARKGKADLFIAIHADAFTNPHSSGASVFALSASGASSEAARWLAEKENYSELGGISLNHKSDLLRSVLIDLSQTGIIRLSLQLGNFLLKDIRQIAHLHHNNVEQARFVVLKSLDIPSILVETGFISNEKEEKRLNDPIYQDQMAAALFNGIHNYFKQYPPPGTRFADDN